MSFLKSKVLSVLELSEFLKALFDNPECKNIQVYGEVYSIKPGKFTYIDLGDQGKDQTNSPILKCAVRSFYNQGFDILSIKKGDVIKVTGDLSYYQHGSSLTMWVSDIEILQNQEGRNLLAKKKTLEKLEKLGYLNPERKRDIPRYCSKVAIITASTGAAYHDIVETLHKRFPVNTVLYPCTVQGDEAAKSILKALKKANESDADVIILGRGGGSNTDLSCFDNEEVAIAIATSKIPIITSIGHSIDEAIADKVSDKKTITPTDGANLINPSLEEIENYKKDYRFKLESLFKSKIHEKILVNETFKNRLNELSPLNKVSRLVNEHKVYISRLNQVFLSVIDKNKNKTMMFSSSSLDKYRLILTSSMHKYNNYVNMLNQLNPLLISSKGYASVFTVDGKMIKSSEELKLDNEYIISYPDGRKIIKVVK